MVHYKLTYFASRGKGEAIRQVFAVAGVEYEDERLSKEEWASRKAGTPFGQIPVLEVDGQPVAQSGAIIRYLARQFGLAGKTPFEEALVDSLDEQFKDFRNESAPYYKRVITGEDKETILKDYLPIRNKCFDILKQWLQKSGSGYLVGDSFTYVDLVVSQNIETALGFLPNYLDDYPELAEHLKKVRSNPKLAKWVEERPHSAT